MAAMIIKIAENGICADRGISGMVAPRPHAKRLRSNTGWKTEWETACKTASFEYRPPGARPQRLSIIRAQRTSAGGSRSEAWRMDGLRGIMNDKKNWTIRSHYDCKTACEGRRCSTRHRRARRHWNL